MTGVILDWHGGSSNLSGWNAAHLVGAVILLFAMLLFNIFGRGERLFHSEG
jgi:hypothetical protein